MPDLSPCALRSARLSLMQKANTLVVLSGLLHSAAKAQAAAAASVPSALLTSLSNALTSDEMRASEHPAIRQQLLAVCTNIVRWLGPRWGGWRVEWPVCWPAVLPLTYSQRCC